MAPRLLHGTLHATIYEVDKLHSGWGFDILISADGKPHKKTKTFLSHVKRIVLCKSEVISRLYATIDLEHARAGMTRMIQNDPSNPRWYENFHIYCAHTVSNIIFSVKYGNPVGGATLIGRAYLPVKKLTRGRVVDKWLHLLDSDKHPIHGGARIHVKLQYFHVTQESNWSKGINSPAFGGVPYTFFKQRQGCKVTLYADAHVPDDNITRFLRSKGYEPQRCWEDMFDAINNAKHLIYITGWSIYTEITLVRDTRRPKPGGDMILGELLKKKANEGVNVLLLVWDDRTSYQDFKKYGLMETHDEETRAYFQNTNVRCVLCPRNPDGGKSVIAGFQVSTMFTHHQKAVVVDSESPEGGTEKRRIISFVGGIDLCHGRYDTRNHSLFGTLNTVHHEDFHQPNFPGSSIKKGGPREPWHDIHCRLEGPVAWDVLYNFEQRWRKLVGYQYIYSVIDLEKFIVHPTEVTTLEDSETWNVQIFRSIDSGAAIGFPEKPEEAVEIGLISGKNNVIDRGIQDAYIHAIRRAKNFIYIENQYFLGSSFDWKRSSNITIENINALHIIPKEISLKIVSKIQAGERFTVYVVIPMWPEGVPESGSVQAILDWQRRTMEMMYIHISNALRAKGLNNMDLREYLTFFCLGNREIKTAGEYIPPEKPDPDTNYSRAQQARRFMIYVHSKMMIVDDEYIIIGSANINQRSMDGARDSEIAMGGFQPHHLANNGPARGQIFGFRMALWCEHLMREDDTFLHPESLECVRNLNAIGDENWIMYSSETFQDNLPGHLLSYPVHISSIGEINVLPGFEFFPDTKARVLGTKSDLLPAILTT